jgi:carboxylate-amine ligase
MICDGESLELVNAIEQLLEDAGAGEIKPELMESVLEISTDPCTSIEQAGDQLRTLRKQVCRTAKGHSLAIGSAGTHPFAMWEDQRIVARPRYRDLIEALRFVARQELIFGMHVHIGLDDPEKAIHVANGMRVHVPVLLALSANSPFWRGSASGLMSTRMPIFRTFPRVGIPPAYRDWDDYVQRIGFMVESGVMEDPTYLWYDVRPHPKFGTVEIRACDSQTRVEHTLGLAALTRRWSRSSPSTSTRARRCRTTRTRCSTRTSGSPRATASTASSSTCRTTRACRPRSSPGGCSTACASTPRTSARRASSTRRGPLTRGTGAHRQRVVFEANKDLREVMAEIVEATTPGRRRGRARPSYDHGGMAPAPSSSSSARTAGRRSARTVTECPYCGTRLRKRAPKIERDGRTAAEAQAPPARRARRSGRCAPARSRASAATSSPAGRDDRPRRARRAVVAGDHPAARRGHRAGRPARWASGGSPHRAVRAR